MNNLFLLLEEQTAPQQGSWLPLILMLGIIVVMFFITGRSQKKQQKQIDDMRNNLQIGDEITTIGGINGRVVTVKEDSIVLETGADRTKMKIMRWAIQTNNTANERAESEKAAFEAAKAAEKEEKKASKRRSKKNEEE